MAFRRELESMVSEVLDKPGNIGYMVATLDFRQAYIFFGWNTIIDIYLVFKTVSILNRQKMTMGMIHCMYVHTMWTSFRYSQTWLKFVQT